MGKRRWPGLQFKLPWFAPSDFFCLGTKNVDIFCWNCSLAGYLSKPPQQSRPHVVILNRVGFGHRCNSTRCLVYWEEESDRGRALTPRNQRGLLKMKCINWPLSDWITQPVWLLENLNVNILISFFHYLTTFAGFWKFRSSIKPIRLLKCGSRTRNWYSSNRLPRYLWKLKQQSAATVLIYHAWRVNLIIVLKINLPSQEIYKK